MSTPRLVTWLRTRSAGVQAARERTLASRADVRQAGVAPNPILDVEVGTIPLGATNPPGLGLDDTAHLTIGLSETIELGKRGPRVRGAELRARASAEDQVGTLADRLGDARLALGKAVYARARVASLEDNLRSARELGDLEQARRRAGDIAESELQRVILDAQAVELDVAHGNAELADTLAECQAVLTVPCDLDDTGVDVLDHAAELPAPTAAASLAERSDLRSLDFQRRGALEDAELARHRAIPDPNVGVAYTQDWLTIAGNQPRSLTFSVGIPLAIFDTGKHDADKAEAHARELDATARGTLEEARAGIAGLASRRKFLEAAVASTVGDAIPRSQSVLEATRKAYETGHVGLSDLILVQRSHRELIARALDLRFELFQTRNDLRRELGLDAGVAREEIGGKSGDVHP